MKYFRTLGKYKASNVELDAKKLKAYSYGWWQFTQPAIRRDTGEKVVLFNDYPYSVVTGGHQRKVRAVLEDDLKLVLVFGKSRMGLNNGSEVLEDMKKNLAAEITKLVEELERKRGRKGSEDANARRERELERMRRNLMELDRLELAE